MMQTSKPKLHKGVTGSAITVHVIAASPANKIEKVLGDGTIQIRLKAKSESGVGNEVLLAYLADVLGVAVRQLELVAGADGADKLIAIANLDSSAVHQRVMDCLKSS